MSCYLCRSNKTKQRPGKVRDNSNLKVLECQNCSLVYLSSFDHIGPDFYEKSLMHGAVPLNFKDWQIETEWDDERRFIQLRSLAQTKKVLDFGCGNGNFLKKISSVASVADGIEPDKIVREYLTPNFFVFPNLDLIADNKYNLITSFHVFEHLSDPRFYLKRLAKLLNHNGMIVIEVPNANDALLTLYNSEAFQNTYWSQHLFLFNKKTLLKLVNQCNLKVFSFQYYQRYPLSNHLYWLSKKLPGGHKIWNFLNKENIINEYSESLSSLGYTDTLIVYIKK